MTTDLHTRPRAEPLEAARVTGYHVYLLVLLAGATFFEGFDQAILGLVAPYVAAEYGIPTSRLGMLLSVVAAGGIAAIVVTMIADRVGRRRVLLWTVAGYAIFSGLTALSRTAVDFVIVQFLARVFLYAELAIALVVAIEEFPAARRALVLAGVMTANLFGAVACAIVLPVMLSTGLGWRAMYLVGLAPLAALFVLRFGLRETRRFLAVDEARRRASASQATPGRASIFAVWRPPYRRRLLLCIVVFGCIAALTHVFTGFYPYFLVNDRGFTPAQVSSTLAIAMSAAIVATPLAGWLMDRYGRRPVGVIAPVCLAIAIATAFNASGSHAAITLTATLAVFAGAFSLPVQVAYATELFPTELRAVANGWICNGLGRAIVVMAPAVTGALVAPLGSIGASVSAIAVAGVVAAAAVRFGMPETRARTLEDTSRIDARMPGVPTGR